MVFLQVSRYKTLRCFVLVVITVALVTNVFILFSTKPSLDDKNDSVLKLFIHARVTHVDSRGIAPYSRAEVDSHLSSLQLDRNRYNTDTQQDGLLKSEGNDQKQQSALDSKNIHSHPTLPHECQDWCRHRQSSPYLLSAVLLVRVYRHDRAGLSSREIFQWLFYLRYAGFEHVFVYDAYVSKNESQYDVLSPLVQSGYVTYIDWSAHNPYTIKGTQIAAYQHCVDTYRSNLTWHMAIDIDEYPFSPLDVEPNFMQRFLHNFSIKNPLVSQMTLQNYLFLGKPLDPQTYPFLIARLRRRTHKKANDLGKSVFRVSHLDTAQVHHNKMRLGKTTDVNAATIRLNHYWGARVQNWGEDTQKVLDITETDYSIKPIVDRLNHCSRCFGADNLYVKRWN
jgi:hypothetical protein